MEKDLNLRDNGTYVFGFLKNTYVLLSEGQGFKQVNFFFPVKITEEDTLRIKSWQKKGYAHNIEFSEEDVSSAKFTFREAFLPTKLQVLKEVIEDVVTYIYDKHPNETPVCSGVNCHNHNNLEIYDDNGLPTPLCPDCAKTIENSYELNEVEKQELPNNYLYGFLGACLFAIPGIIFAILLY
ncbi:MAG: hypothetical protein J6W45_03100, partial [Bacteroidales bacterium]|nr:hypothetical protein [Bacteroidales bacterium]